MLLRPSGLQPHHPSLWWCVSFPTPGPLYLLFLDHFHSLGPSGMPPLRSSLAPTKVPPQACTPTLSCPVILVFVTEPAHNPVCWLMLTGLFSTSQPRAINRRPRVGLCVTAGTFQCVKVTCLRSRDCEQWNRTDSRLTPDPQDHVFSVGTRAADPGSVSMEIGQKGTAPLHVCSGERWSQYFARSHPGKGHGPGHAWGWDGALGPGVGRTEVPR